MKQKRSQIGCLFWVALVLLVLVVVLFNRPRFEQALKGIGLNNLVTNHLSSPKGPAVTRIQESPSSGAPRTQSAPTGQSKGGSGSVPSGAGAPAGGGSSAGPASSPPSRTRSLPSRHPAATTEPSPTGERSQPFELYFVQVGSDGKADLVSIPRKVSFVDSPLTRTMNALLEGVSFSEKDRGLVSLIPPGTTLIDARVENGTAYLNFSDRFRFNSLGREGYDLELKQVVYTATQFPTVKRVQILLDGQVREYLGPEGLAIGSPLDRKALD